MTDKKKTIELKDDELKSVVAGSDIESLRFAGKVVPLPEAKSKKEEDGGYVGNTNPNPPEV